MANNAPIKSLSFDSRIHDENKNKPDEKDIGKSFSFAARVHSDSDSNDKDTKSDGNDQNNNNSNEGNVCKDTNDNKDNNAEAEESNKVDQEISLDQLTEEIDQFIVSLFAASAKDQQVEISDAVAQFLKRLETTIEMYESSSDDDNSVVFGRDHEADSSFIEAIKRLSSLMRVLNGFKSNYTMPLVNQASSVLHRAMVFLEDELRYLLEDPTDSISSNSTTTNQQQQQQKQEGGELCVLPDQNADSNDTNQQEGKDKSDEETTTITFPSYSCESISTISLISKAMIASGYDSECCNVFIITRRHAFEEELKKQGFEKISVDDIQRMSWESLEGEIATWIRAFKHCSNHLFPGEHKFYDSILSDHPTISSLLLTDLSSAVFSLLVSFAEAVSMTKRSTEKLFKFLDMYEALRDMNLNLNVYPDDCVRELRPEISFAGSRLGEAAVSVFCQLENSIKSDNAKTPVPSGAVHPLTRYTMNYLKYACEYKDTLEQVFQQHLKTEQTQEENKESGNKESPSPFAAQLMTIMELLDKNLEAKSKLYKDPSLRYIFMMNNGRYMLQKAKGSAEIHQVVGDNWCRKRSSDVRHYHKSYQRETWSRVLQCLNHEGLQVNGKVHKPVLKERFKNFNQLFDEIHKTQSTWVVSDEQLQSELRVSVSAVMIPAYRSFVARFGQIFTPGRQVEKYIKYQPEDIETVIEELFDGNPNSMVRRRT